MPAQGEQGLAVAFIHEFFGAWFNGAKREKFETAARGWLGKDQVNFIYKQGASEKTGNVDSRSESITPPEPALFSAFLANGTNQTALVEAMKAGRFREGGAEEWPVLIFMGASGTGKTHLLEAIHLSLARSYGLAVYRHKAAFFCARQKNADSRAIELFWNRHHALILDDLQEILGERAWEQVLANHIDSGCANARRQQEGQPPYPLIFACCGAPGIISQAGSRLASRLQRALVLELAEPDMETRIRYLENANRMRGLELKRSQILALARTFTRMPQLKGALRKIGFLTKISEASLSPVDFEIILQGADIARPVDFRGIISRVGARFELKPEEILAQGRKPDVVMARQISMYLCRNSLGLSYPELGKLFGGKDHSTVIHSIKKICQLRKTDKVTHKLLTELEENGR